MSTPKQSEARRMLLFSLSGAIGNVLFYFMYELLFAGLETYIQSSRRSTVAWTLSYLTSIAWQHSLHRVLVFGTGGSFWRSLVWTYVSYTAALILSTLMNDALTQYAGVAHRYAWGITLIATGVLNYYTVKSAFAEVPAKPTEPSKRSSTARNGSTPSADGRKRDSKSSATATRSRSSKQA